jgi:CubicO group peptidase (beta-lactamase class C family)
MNLAGFQRLGVHFAAMGPLIRGLVAALLPVPLMAAGIALTKPEDVGLSTERLGRIHALVERHIADKDLSGAVTLVARRGKVVHFEAHGLADIDARKPMQTGALYRLASMTKPLTAVSILMLMEDGRLLLSDPVSKYIAEFRDPRVAVWRLPNDPSGPGATLVPAAREITIKDLLTHTSGLANGFNGPAGDFVRRANLPTGGSLDERVRRLGKLPLNFQPGSQWEYSPGTGFDTLGRIIEIQSGMNLSQFFKARIFDPLGMKDSFFDIPESRRGDLVVAYVKNEKGLVPAPPSPALSNAPGQYYSGAGGMTSTAQDYLQFCQMLLNGGQLNGTRLISRKSVELMTSDAIPGLDLRNYTNATYANGGEQILQGYGFGLGVRIRRNNGENGWLGTPGDYGWAGALGTYFWIDPKEQLVAMILMQTPIRPLRMEFPNAVYQAFID